MKGSWTYVTGGTLAPDASSYVERQADRDLVESLREGKFCYVLNSRQMGKSSLCVRTMGVLREAGTSTAFVDLTKLGGRNVTPDQWYIGIANEIGRGLGLRAEFMAYWKQNLEFSPVQRLFGAIREVALEKLETPLAIFVDEIDATRSLSFSTDEFFAAIREGYNRRVQDPVFERLTFCLLGVAVPSDLINSPTSTPFNIGERIYLQDFTLDEALPLSRGLARPGAEDLLRRVHYWTNGQPFLTQSLCAAIAGDQAVRTPKDVDAMVDRDLFQPEARETNINLADVANRALHAGDLEDDPEKFRADLLSAYERAWRGRPLVDDEANRVAALLKLSGMMRAEGNQLKVRNRIYQTVFGKAWIADNMPGQEKRRQKRSFWRGALRSALVGTAVVAVVSYFGVTAYRAQQTAEAAKKELDYRLYVANMNVMQLLDQEGDSVRMSQILDETRNSPHRGWEWGYWNAKVHDAPEEYVPDSTKRDKLPGSILSADGKELLIYDRTLESAFLVDRTRRRLIGRYLLKETETPMATSAGWMAYEEGKTVTVRDLKFGLKRLQIDFTKTTLGGSVTVARGSDYLLITAATNTKKTLVTESAVWDVRTRRKDWKLPSTGEYGLPLSITRDGQRTCYLVFDITGKSTLVVYDHSLGKEIFRKPAAMERAGFGGLSPDGKYMTIIGDKGFQVFDLATKRIVMNVLHEGESYQTAKIDSSGNYLVHSSSRGTDIRAFPSGDVISTYPFGQDVQFSQGREVVLSGTSIKILPIRNVSVAERTIESGEVSRDFKGRFLVNDVLLDSPYWTYSNPSVELVSKTAVKKESYTGSGRLKTIRKNNLGMGSFIVLEAETGRTLGEFEFGTLFSAAWKSDKFVTYSLTGGKVSCYAFGSIIPLWEHAEKDSGMAGSCYGLMSPDGYLVLFVNGKDVRILDSRSGKTLQSYEGAKQGYPVARFIGVNHDYWISSGGSVTIYDGSTLTPKFTIPLTSDSVWGCDISPDGRRVAVSVGRSLNVIDSQTGERVFRFAWPQIASGSLFTSDGKKLLASSQSGVKGKVFGTSDIDPRLRIPVEGVPFGDLDIPLK